MAEALEHLLDEFDYESYSQWAAENPNRAPCDEMLVELHYFYRQILKLGGTLREVANRTDGVRKVRLYSWLQTVQRRGLVEMATKKKKAKKQQDFQVSESWLEICMRAEQRRLVHLDAVARLRVQNPLLSYRQISDDLRVDGVWPHADEVAQSQEA